MHLSCKKQLFKNSIVLGFLLAGFILLLFRCINKAEAKMDVSGAAYAGAASCSHCYQAVYDSSVNNAHSKATAQAIAKNIRGNYSNEKDSFSFNNLIKMAMEKETMDITRFCTRIEKRMVLINWMFFYFKMGDTLAFFFLPKFKQIEEDIDVHDNQFSLLQKSLCFIKINNMTCCNCHSAHQNTNPDIAMYSQTCVSCHQPEKNNFCPKYASLGKSIKSNCIDCHLPK